MEKELDILDRIGQVDAPPFLFTRIQEKVKAQLAERFTKKQAILCLVGMVVVIAINVFALRSSAPEPKENDLVSGMNLSPSNQLYR